MIATIKELKQGIKKGKSIVLKIKDIIDKCFIETVFGGTSRFWVRLQSSYDLFIAAKNFMENRPKLHAMSSLDVEPCIKLEVTGIHILLATNSREHSASF